LNDLQKIIVGSVVLGLSYIIFLGSTFLASAHLNFFVPLLFVGILLFSCGEQLFYPASATIVGEIGPAEKRGKSISSYQLLYGINNAMLVSNKVRKNHQHSDKGYPLRFNSFLLN